MNLQWLYYFDAIAELEHYTKAAELLHVSQSNLSHAISELEDELGVKLFERKGRNIRLTKYGDLFRPYVKQSITALETGVKTLRDYIDPNSGTIVLAGFQSVAQFATDLMVRYQSETNRLGVQFNYSQEGWGDICNMILNGKADLIIATKVDDPRIEGTLIGSHRLALLVYEKHRLASRESVDLKELDGENFISYDRNGELITNLWKILNSLHVKPNVVTETPNDLIVYGLVAAERGVAVVPYPLGNAPYGTKVIPISNRVAERKLYLQWNRERYIPPATEYFRDYVIRNGEVFNQYLERQGLTN